MLSSYTMAFQNHIVIGLQKNALTIIDIIFEYMIKSLVVNIK